MAVTALLVSQAVKRILIPCLTVPSCLHRAHKALHSGRIFSHKRLEFHLKYSSPHSSCAEEASPPIYQEQVRDSQTQEIDLTCNVEVIKATGRLSWMEICQEMPVVIHGRTIAKSDKCERLQNGDIKGHWLVNFDEPACRPYWGDLYDKGCIEGGSGMKRVEARIWGLKSGEDWAALCGSTSATIDGRWFDRPTRCEWRGIFHGMVGCGNSQVSGVGNLFFVHATVLCIFLDVLPWTAGVLLYFVAVRA
ncbi:hypothetical protein A0H81_03926 [Grifola frondosa]|uniref:Uncharacterized protein n=1 Tax=Grifola frondosa TaxID=5627 RepID=A0A1C7MGZ4_GRIFR|nr:hypothetical protein A0H81_03926 [Grifola frondosa]